MELEDNTFVYWDGQGNRYEIPVEPRILPDGQKITKVGGFLDDDVVIITDEMIEAGYRVLCGSGIADEYTKADKCTVAEIFRAMMEARDA